MARLFDDQENIALFVLAMDNLLDLALDHATLFSALITLLRKKTSSDALRSKALDILCGSFLARNPSKLDDVVKIAFPFLLPTAETIHITRRLLALIKQSPPLSSHHLLAGFGDLHSHEVFAAVEGKRKGDVAKDKTLVAGIAQLATKTTGLLAANLSKTRQLASLESFLALLEAEVTPLDSRMLELIVLNQMVFSWTDPELQLPVAQKLFACIQREQIKLPAALKYKLDSFAIDFVSNFSSNPPSPHPLISFFCPSPSLASFSRPRWARSWSGTRRSGTSTPPSWLPRSSTSSVP